MIIDANGILRVKIAIASESDLDSKGYPTTFEGNWGEPIVCNIKTNGQANIGTTTSGNTFEATSFEVLIEEQPFNADIVQLVRHGVNLGIFQVQGNPELLSAVDNIKIFVKCLSNV